MKIRTAVLMLALAPFAAAQAHRQPVKPATAPAAHMTSAAAIRVNGEQAIRYAQDIVNYGPRWDGSPAKAKVEDFIRKTFARDQLEADHFTPNTTAGLLPMTNYIVRFPGTKPGVVVLASHYETNYPLRNINFVGANDGAATSGLLMEIANHLRGTRLEGYSIWLVFFDGEEATTRWTPAPDTSGELYGSRHLAAKWAGDGTLKQIKAFILFDMIGDKDLDIVRDLNSTPWLLDMVQVSANKLGFGRYFFKSTNQIEDDQLPFVQRGVPVADLIDFDFGPHDAKHPDGYHHTVEDTMDKISAHSLMVVGNTTMETIAALNRR